MLIVWNQWSSHLPSIVFCCLLYLLQCVESSVKIHVDYPANAVIVGNQTFVLPGSNLKIKCQLATTLPGTSVAIAGPTQISVTATTTVTLRLTSISADNHGGAYTCFDNAGSADHFHLNVWDDNSLIAPPVVTNGTVGHVILQCIQKFRYPLALIWRYEYDSRILNDIPKREHTYFVKRDTHLTITNTGRHSSKTGKYMCELDVTNHTQELRKLSKEVIYAATPDVGFLESDYNTAAIKNQDHSLTCIYYGHSTEQTKWIWKNATTSLTIFDFNDTRVACPKSSRVCTNTPSRYQLYRDEDREKYKNVNLRDDASVSVLTIQNINQYDLGEFWCYARNEHGENGAMVFLRVKDPVHVHSEPTTNEHLKLTVGSAETSSHMDRQQLMRTV